MTAQTVEASQAREPTWGARAGMLGWGLLTCWVIVLVSVLFLGERSSSFAQLEADVASGEVAVARVSGGLLHRGAGYAVVDVHWRHGLFGYTTQVLEVRPRRAAPRRLDEGVTAVIDQSVRARLSASDPDVRVVHVQRRSGMTAEILGWRVTGWPAGLFVATWLACLMMLVGGPRPLRATRWAWFWLILLVPVGVTAFLLLAGPTSLLPGPRVGARRLTGGWAFLLGLVLGPLFHPVR